MSNDDKGLGLDASIKQAPPLRQGSDAWKLARLGRVSGTRIGALIGASPWVTREQAILDMVTEIRTGTWTKVDVTAPMRWGTEKEPVALRAYEGISFESVDEASIYTHPEREKFVASPDGLIGDHGYLEIKCPYKYRAGAPQKWADLRDQLHYYAQVQWGLYVTGRQWADFFQWAPTGTPHLERVQRDEEFIAMLVVEAERALVEVELELQGERETDPASEYDHAVGEIARLKAELKEAEQSAAAALALIADRHGEGWEFSDGRRLVKKISKGSISYASIVKEHLPQLDIEPYRGAERESWTVEIPK